MRNRPRPPARAARGRLDRPRSPIDPLLLAGTLTVLLGLQIVRVFLPLNSFYFYDARGYDPLVPAAVALACFGAGFLAPVAARLFGLRPALLAAATGLGLARLLEQGLLSPGLDIWIAGLGICFFSLSLPLFAAAARRDPAGGPERLALAFLVGTAGDTALSSLLRTLDLSWYPALATLVVLSVMIFVLGASVASLPLPDAPRERAGAAGDLPWGFTLLGPWLFLQMVAFQNVAALAARSGWGLRATATAVGVANAVGLLAAAGAARSGTPGRWRVGFAAALVVGATLFHRSGLWSVAGGVLGQTGAAGCLLPPGPPFGGRRSRSFLPSGLPQALLVLLFFLYYASFEYRLGVPRELLIAAACLLLAGRPLLRPGVGAAPHPPLPGSVAVAAALAALAGPGLLALTWRPPDALKTGPTREVRLMTYNLHQGFRPDGRLDARGLARTISASAAEVVALQEVSRGWVVNGSLDLFEWLKERLRMEGRFAATAGPQWGNAVLSRYPIASFHAYPLPPPGLPLARGVIDAEIDLGQGQTLRLLATHLHHRDGDDAIRNEQTQALLRLWMGSPRTLIAGDLNARPESAAIGRLQAAGFLDAASLLPARGRSTHVDSEGPQQIDYILGTGDLAFRDTAIPYSLASDHLPVVSTVILPAAPPP